MRPSAQAVGPILKLNGSNDVFPPNDDSFEGHGEICLHKSPKWGVNRQFQVKTRKSIHRNISGTSLSIYLSIYLKSRDYGDVSAETQQGRLTM